MGGVDVLPASNALKRRTVTALVLVPFVLAAVLWLPTPAFALFFAAVLIPAALEWCTLAGVIRPVSRVVYTAAILSAMALLWSWPQAQPWWFGLSALWWAVQTVVLLRIHEVHRSDGVQRSLLAVGFLVLVGPWAALVYLHQFPGIGPALVIFLLFLMWTADSMAYFVGRAWGGGRAKLAPVLSPGKTRIGVYGALAGAMICGLVFAWIRSSGLTETLLILLICGLLFIVIK